jgi:hypothetical protein
MIRLENLNFFDRSQLDVVVLIVVGIQNAVTVGSDIYVG